MMASRSGQAGAQAKQRTEWAIVVRWLIISVIVLAVGVNLVSPVLAWRWTKLPFAGAVWEHSLVVSGVRGTHPWSAQEVGVNGPDRIVAINGRPVSNALELERILATMDVGSTIQLTFECQGADGNFTRHQATVELSTFPLSDLISLFVIPYFIGLVYLLIGVWVYRTRPDQRASQSFCFFCANVAIFTGSFFDSFTTHRLVWLWTAALPLVSASIVHLALVFPEERGVVRRYPVTRLLVYVPAAILSIVAVASLYNPTDPRAYFGPWRWSFAASGIGVATFLILLMYTRLRPGSATVRQQTRIVLLGSILAFSPIGLWGLWAASGTQLPFYSFLYFPPMIIFPLTVAYAIVRYRLLDVDLVISRGVAYSLLTIIVIGSYSITVSALGQLLRMATPASNPVVIAFFILALVLVINRLRNGLQRLVDRVFYKEHPDYRQALQEFSRALTATLDLSVLLDMLLTRVGDMLHVQRVMVFLIEQPHDEYVVSHSRGVMSQVTRSVRFSNDDAITDWLREKMLYLESEESGLITQSLPQEEQARLLCLGVVLCVPLRVADELIGWLALGPKLSQDLYGRDDLSFLATLADQAAIAIENARLLERTQRRARELALLNEVNQAITSTLDLDGVLNQIMTNVVDILGVEAGSLMLLDEDTEELVFQIALGAAGTEALQHVRLALGQGIAGTVAQQGKPLIVNKAAADRRWFQDVDKITGFATRNILCVPLISHERTIGVIEVLNKRDGSPFDQHELNLLSSLASQAAIAIENARLYTMTDEALVERVSELSVMQEIDRQLNATLDFERVMNLTLDWAIRITGAPTGVLVLVDKEQGKFRLLAHRGYPQELVHDDRRWPLDRGIVGRVVRTGKPALVSDVTQDADYENVVPSTRSQLTVPIWREDQVIAVINLESPEVGGFGEDDVARITRLADHAAIAIENARLYADVKRANQAKSEFVSLVSHELKLPMTSIKGYAKLLTMGTAGSVGEQQRNYLNTIISNVDRMQALVNDLLDISRIETGQLYLQLQPLVLHPLVEEVVQSMRDQIEVKDLALTIDVPPDLPSVLADKVRISQVLTNLVGNAYKYTRPGGRVGVRAKRMNGFIICSVSDTGIGISPEDQTRLFDKFFRADHPVVREVAGTGLGLSIAKNIVELHGGEMWVESKPEAGSTFNFTLPVAGQDDQPASPART